MKLNLTQLHHLADTCPIDFAFALQQLDDDDDGFLGTGADLQPATLLHAYRLGIFPWFGKNDPICWYSPTPRCVISPTDFRPKKSLIRTAKKSPWQISINHAFEQVIDACSQPRAYSNETWIGQEMKDAYQQLHRLGVAVSVEVWQDKPMSSDLIGGLYGLHLGSLFCGESMFHKQTDASKIAFWGLMNVCQKAGVLLVDCQLENPHLMSLGARLCRREAFLQDLPLLTHTPCQAWDTQTIKVCELVSH